MPRYYFNVACDEFETIDIVGEHCRDDLEALSGAMRVASAMMRERMLANDSARNGWIEVEDERHRPVLKLPLRAAAY